MPHHKERPARKATSRLALYLVFAFIVAAILAFIWVNMHACQAIASLNPN